MKEHPILFSTEMVKAILEGRKTQTRRIVKKQLNQHLHLNRDYIAEYDEGKLVKCPFGQPGDLLWMREQTINIEYRHYHDLKNEGKTPPLFLYKRDYEPSDWSILQDKYKYDKWKSPIHMLKDAARIWMQVTDIRVERLHEISEQDAIAEGIEQVNQAGVIEWKRYDDYYQVSTNPVVSFWSLWANIHSEESWDANPWVWAVSFKVLSTTGKPQL